MSLQYTCFFVLLSVRKRISENWNQLLRTKPYFDVLVYRTFTSSLNWSSKTSRSLMISHFTSLLNPSTSSGQASRYSSMCCLQEEKQDTGTLKHRAHFNLMQVMYSSTVTQILYLSKMNHRFYAIFNINHTTFTLIITLSIPPFLWILSACEEYWLRF